MSVTYIRRTRTHEVTKWLRQHGERFVDWEMSGGYHNLTIKIMNDKLELAYIMTWEWGNPDPKSNRT
jgi:hypothetical protein